jgi:SNF2 family DNA or RNA helicase
VVRKHFTPRPYQLDIIERMLTTPRCNIWAGMGMGKTCAGLTVIDIEFLAGVQTKPALVIAPLRVAQSTWPDEAAKWDHLNRLVVQPIIGTAEERAAALRNKQANVFTINFENIPWLLEHLKGTWPFGRVIADESTKLKSFRTRQGGKRARALASVAHRSVSHWTNLTGTPSPNGLKDLWGQQWFIDAGERLGRSFNAFSNRWFRPDRSGFGVVPLPFAQEQIQDAIRGTTISLNPKDYFDLREPIVTPIYVELPKKARLLYTEMSRRFFMEIQGHEIEALNAAAKSQKLLQLASGAVYVDPLAEDDEHPKSKEFVEVHDVKIQALESIIGEAAGAHVLVAYHFKSDLARLQKSFPMAVVLGTDPDTIRRWNAGEIPVLLAHPASAGHGLNLQDGGNIIVFFSHDWNLENFLQIIERIGPVRQAQSGYDRPVWVYHIIARGTMDDTVMASRDGKKTIQDLLLESAKRSKL